MENIGSRPEEDTPPPHSPEKDVKVELVNLLRTKGLHDKDTKAAFHAWEEFNGLEKIQQENNVEEYIKLAIEKAELFAGAGFKDEALDILKDLLILSEAHHYLDSDVIEAHIDNLSK